MEETTVDVDTVLRRLVGRAHEFEPIDFSAQDSTDLLPGVAGKQLDDVLLDAEHESLVCGRRKEYGERIVWTHLRLTVRGLRHLGEWPPVGLEHQPGPWTQGVFGRVARPVLAALRDEPPTHNYVVAPLWGMPEEQWSDWRALELLLESGLVSASRSANSESLDNVRLTPAGREALDPSERDPLDTAVRKLMTGSKIEAMIIAVEKAVGPRLHALAREAGVPTSHPDGTPLKLARVNDSLKKAGVLTESERTVIESMLKRRNDCGHGNDERVSDAQAEVVIAEARVFLEEHPAPTLAP